MLLKIQWLRKFSSAHRKQILTKVPIIVILGGDLKLRTSNNIVNVL